MVSNNCRQLLLWRHAKSDWSDSSLADHDRPLATRGVKAAQRMANWLLSEKLIPEQVLCSSAVRTKQTLEFLTRLQPIPTTFDSQLYHAEPDQILAIISKVNPDIKRLMLVGHNPGYEQLEKQLNAQTDHPAMQANKVMPTGAIALFEFDGDWQDCPGLSMRLVTLVRPKTLTHKFIA
ncbi:histidine phosphatase [Thiomicrospira aerophila AL3]|uniref:Histidine phosphatase n=1 Tax=Thiomicrospira aerophila AL3 TaxID=717772 RepID=W0DQ95_9GAMM|nr:histidine phosphatase family protein [Thiomicrospira aerophila]AHF00632.1 histidine phosphatase [Thiomicrospira aerophila AL3]